MGRSKRRLDQLLVDRRLAETRSKARALVISGSVRIDGRLAEKAGMLVDEEALVEVVAPPRHVSRGGDKLAAALAATGIDPRNRICLDIGASTGGFTDCLLQHGAAIVIAVDVGYGQLAWRLRQDPRVVVLERVNARYLTREDLPAKIDRLPDLLVIDVAFIGVGKILPAAGTICAPRCDALVLVKPQFECGPDVVGPGGIVVRAADRRDALLGVAQEAIALGWGVGAAVPSPIRGAAGNWECFLQLARPAAAAEAATYEDVIGAVEVPDDLEGS